MKFSIVIPNYNGEKLIERNIPRLLDVLKEYVTKHNQKVEVIIVDDASEDNSREVIGDIIKHNPEKRIVIKTTENKHNLGFSSTVNKGVTLAEGEIIILFNTDLWPTKGLLDHVSHYFAEENLFAVGFMDKSVEGENVVLRGRGVGTWKRGFLMHGPGDIHKTNTLWASGGSSAFRKTIWDKLGGLYDIYDPFYWEDIDLSYRALKAGYTILFAPEIIVTHEHEKGAIRTHYTATQYRTISYRNTLYFVWINITDTALLLSHLLWLPYHFIKTFSKDGFAFSHAFLTAVAKFPRILSLRRKVKHLSVKTDGDVLKDYLS